MTTPDFRKGLGKDCEYVFGNAVVDRPNMKHESTILFKNTKVYADAFKAKFNTDPDYNRGRLNRGGDCFQEATSAHQGHPSTQRGTKRRLGRRPRKTEIS